MSRTMSLGVLTLLTLLLSSSSAAPIEVVSKPFQPRPSTFGDSADLDLPADGPWAVYTSAGTGITTNDVGQFILNVFLKNMLTGETTLVSASNGTNRVSGNGHSYGAMISADARFIVFETEADNLVEEDTNQGNDVVLYDRETGTVSLISGTTNGVAEGSSGAPWMTRNGRFILFESDASDFSDLDVNDWVDLYLMDRETGEVRIVTLNAAGTATAGSPAPARATGTYEATVDASGRYVAFLSSGTNHVLGVPASSQPHVYLRDMQTGTNIWLTRSSNVTASASASSPVVSSNGTLVAFLSTPLAGPTSPSQDFILYLYEIATGSRRAILSATGTPFPVTEFSLSENGGYIAFSSSNQVYLHDLSAGTTRLVSVATDGTPASGISGSPEISDSGRHVAFSSTATNLAAGVFGDVFQTYRFDSETGQATLLSRAVGGSGGANADTYFPVLAGNALWVGFASYASNLVTNDNPLVNDVFVAPFSGDPPVLLVSSPHPSAISSTAAGGSQIEGQGLSADGRRLVFTSGAEDLVPNDTNAFRDIFLSDLQTGVTRLVNLGPDGAQLPGPASLIGVSLDANRIAFVSSNVVNGTNARSAFVFDATTGTSKVANILQNGDIPTTLADSYLSPDGRYFAFRPSTQGELSVRILDTATTFPLGQVPGLISGAPIIGFSRAGNYLIMRGQGTPYNVVDWKNRKVVLSLSLSEFHTNAFSADDAKMIASVRNSTAATVLHLFQLDAGTNSIAVVTNAMAAALSADGSTMAYVITNGLYTFDTESGAASAVQINGTNAVFRPRGPISISADGRFVAFATTTALTGEEDNDFIDIFVYDRVLKTTVLASESLNGSDEIGGATSPLLSADGRVLAFESAASHFVANDRNMNSDVFIRRLTAVDSDADGLEDGWETVQFGGLSATADADADNDGISNRNEFRAGTDPNSAASRFQIQTEVDQENRTLLITTPAMPGRTYQLQHSATLTEAAWQDVGSPRVAFSESVTLAAPYSLQGTGFFRVKAVE